ncbi:MAG: ribosome maturation factor RimP [Sulfurovum sp. AS07-7]|nr:MAG: ribosome maturation factor RimP [Sulfurovum sp. AS07-7]
MNLEEHIEKIVESHGAFFYGTESLKDDGETIYRVYITAKGGVNLDMCSDIAKELSPFFDVHPPLSDGYYLEVSSPGIERKLLKPRQFKHSVGEMVKLKIKGGDKPEGELIEATDEGISIKIPKDDEVKSYLYSDILQARTYYDWNR